ncbi:MAG TPA: hypothetical protein VGF49_12485 [Candidatus Solibacter sp.]
MRLGQYLCWLVSLKTGALANLLFLTPTTSRRPRMINLGVQVSF